ncbi:MAG TPA: type IIA DNA topoisomerase subunit B, partial [Bacteroidia bacterium]|nr:type IIA DNA topoisomerase subunit B [Bacteroidia bacterium]
IYCYDENEKQAAMVKLGKNPEITRFKGLGEISPNEFGAFIGEHMRLDPVIIRKDSKITEMLDYYMGKNTPDRQDFIIDNLRVEKLTVEEVA